MEELWTPWRMPYIAGTKRADECIFCPPPGPNPLDRHVVHRDAHTFTLMNLYPYTVGHLMVVPRRHIPRFAELTTPERAEIARGLDRAERILRRVLGAQHFHAGINLGRAAGAGVDGHLHVHLVPRGLPTVPSLRGNAPPDEEPPVAVDEVFARLLPYFSAEA